MKKYNLNLKAVNTETYEEYLDVMFNVNAMLDYYSKSDLLKRSEYSEDTTILLEGWNEGSVGSICNLIYTPRVYKIMSYKKYVLSSFYPDNIAVHTKTYKEFLDVYDEYVDIFGLDTKFNEYRENTYVKVKSFSEDFYSYSHGNVKELDTDKCFLYTYEDYLKMKIFEIFVNTKTFEEFKYTINSIGNPNNLDIDKEYMLYGEKTCVNIHKGCISNLDRCEDDMGCGIIGYEEWK